MDSLRNGNTDIAIVPSDVLADALAGEGPFASRGPDPESRILFTGHADAFTIVARREVGIHSAAELRHRRVDMGSPGSGERVSMERVMAALGVTWNSVGMPGDSLEHALECLQRYGSEVIAQA